MTYQYHKDNLSNYERQRLMEAREILLEDMSSAPTIAQLAQKVGLNQLKLKKRISAIFWKQHIIMLIFNKLECSRRFSYCVIIMGPIVKHQQPIWGR